MNHATSNHIPTSGLHESWLDRQIIDAYRRSIAGVESDDRRISSFVKPIYRNLQLRDSKHSALKALRSSQSSPLVLTGSVSFLLLKGLVRMLFPRQGGSSRRLATRSYTTTAAAGG
ncbi:MAG: hypothetical protein IPM23_09740 [Candidatus Melainabacteria bacterium]|nr:hypothetical protein [Candidatus Melainabacteria bacterium]